MIEGSRRVRRVAPGRLLRVADDTGLGFAVALGRDVQWGLGWVGAHRGRRGAGRGGRRGCWCGRGRASGGRRVRLLVERAADPVHHGPPGRPGGVAGCGRWRRGSRIAGRAEAPDMVVRVQGGGRASHGGAGTSPAGSRAPRAHRTAHTRVPHTAAAHENQNAIPDLAS